MRTATANKVILLGNVGSDPDIRITSGGVKMAAVSVATTTRMSGSPEERTEWHRIHLWGRLAQVAEDYASKGDKVYVVGSLRYDSYERDGICIPTAEIHGTELVLVNRGTS